MKELVEKINAEFEVFAANAAAQVEKGNKAAGHACPQIRARNFEADEGIPQGIRRGCQIRTSSSDDKGRPCFKDGLCHV